MRAAVKAAVTGGPAFWAVLSAFLYVAWLFAGAVTGVAGVILWLAAWAFREWRAWREAGR